MQSQSDAALLAQLSRSLTVIAERRLASQLEIQKVTGVDQPTISRAQKGKLKRVTDKIERLMDYANMKLSPPPMSETVSTLTARFYEAGGTEKELVASVEHAITLVTRRLQREGE